MADPTNEQVIKTWNPNPVGKGSDSPFPKTSKPYTGAPQKKSTGLPENDPKTEVGLTETRRGFNITHPIAKFATPENGYGMGISFIKANQPENPIWFPGFMITFSDSFSQNVNREKVFGRMDPLQVYESTERRISFSWQVVSISEEEGRYNIEKINSLVKALYPDYTQNSSGAYNVTTSALIGINFHGLAHGNLKGGSKSSNAKLDLGTRQYLFGYIESLTMEHQFEGGVFESYDGGQATSEGNKSKLSLQLEKQGSVGGHTSSPLIAKVINLNVSFSPIHPETLGFDQNGDWISNDSFPYTPHLNGNDTAPTNANIPDVINADFTVSEQKRAAYEAYQAQLAAQGAEILSPQNPWQRAGNKIAGAYNKTVDFFDSLVTTEGEDPNTGL